MFFWQGGYSLAPGVVRVFTSSEAYCKLAANVLTDNTTCIGKSSIKTLLSILYDYKIIINNIILNKLWYKLDVIKLSYFSSENE